MDGSSNGNQERMGGSDIGHGVGGGAGGRSVRSQCWRINLVEANIESGLGGRDTRLDIKVHVYT